MLREKDGLARYTGIGMKVYLQGKYQKKYYIHVIDIDNEEGIPTQWDEMRWGLSLRTQKIASKVDKQYLSPLLLVHS